jgi:type I restriction enzyme S subunit
VTEELLWLKLRGKYSKIEKIYNNATQIQTLKQTRDTLLPKLMSGQLRVDEFKSI